MFDSGRPSSSRNLDGMAIDIDSQVESCDGIDPKSVSITKTGDPECMLRVKCRAVSGRAPRDVILAVEGLWMKVLRYDRESHRVTSSDATARLDFATQDGAGFVVTGTIEVSST